jgi:hypothetical protein
MTLELRGQCGVQFAHHEAACTRKIEVKQEPADQADDKREQEAESHRQPAQDAKEKRNRRRS